MTGRCTFAYPKCWHRVWDQGCTCCVEPKRCPRCGRQLAKDKKNDRPLPAHIAGLREAAKIVQERRDAPRNAAAQAWQAALEELIDKPGKEVMPDVSGHFSSHDAAPASLSAGGGAKIKEAPDADV